MTSCLGTFEREEVERTPTERVKGGEEARGEIREGA
jgi:hypothetical protein